MLALTAVAPPASALPVRRVVPFAAAFMLAYFGVALATGLDAADIGSAIEVEILVTRLALLGLLAFGLAYTSDALRRLALDLG